MSEFEDELWRHIQDDVDRRIAEHTCPTCHTLMGLDSSGWWCLYCGYRE